ncbi:MAG: aminomethyltransferase family protein, partial [Acetobacteraceae bacterium]
YVGELGWELYVPTEFVQDVFDRIIAEGADVGVRLAGYHAMNSLRLEKGYRSWEHDITDADTPLEAGLGFAVAWDKPDGFIGRDALLRQRDAGVRRRLVHLAAGGSDRLLYHNEPIWRDGALVGRTTSGMFGHTLGKPLALGYIENHGAPVDDAFVTDGRYEIEIAGERVAAEVTLRPFYDPTGRRIRA